MQPVTRGEQARQAALAALGGPAIEADDQLRTLVRLAASIAGVPTATLNLIGSDVQCQVATLGFEGADSPREESMCNVTLEAATMMHVPDASKDPLFRDNAWVTGARGNVRFYAAFPIITAEHDVLGTICVFDEVPRVLDGEQIAQLVDVSLLALALLERRRDAQRSDELAAAAQEARDLVDLTLAELEERHEFIEALLETVDVGIIAADAEGRLTLFNRATRTWHGVDPSLELASPEWATYYDLYEADGVTRLPAARVPLLRALHDGRVDGAEIVIAPPGVPPTRVVCTGRSLRRADGAPLGAFVAMTDVTRQRQLEEDLRSSALRDALTGLPNRTLLLDRLEYELAASTRSGEQVAVLFCDLDGFKAVNDRSGHAAGDDVIVEISRRMADCLRPADTVGRLAGDEFVLICPGVTLASARAIVERVTERVAAPITARGSVHRLGVSIGVALSYTGVSAQELIERADHEMYEAKGGKVPAMRHGLRTVGSS